MSHKGGLPSHAGHGRKGMYGPLACLVPRLGAQKLLGSHPRLLYDTVAALSEYGLCSPAAALLLALVKQLRRELPATGAPTP